MYKVSWLILIHYFFQHAILCPTLFSCCYRKYRDHHHKKEFKSTDLYNHSTEEGFLKTPVSSSHGMPLQQNTPQRSSNLHVANVTETVQLAKKVSIMGLIIGNLYKVVF